MTAAKKKILIVEDEYFLAEMLRQRLEFVGYEVACAENGVAALEHLREYPVDLILMDIMMPQMDGWEATRRIKADKKTKQIPVVVLTARARPEDRKQSYEVGAEDYLSKPFDFDDMVAVIERWLKR